MFWRVTGWKDEEEEVEAREAGWSIVATDISAPMGSSRRLDLSFALENRLGTSARGEWFIYVRFLPEQGQSGVAESEGKAASSYVNIYRFCALVLSCRSTGPQ